MALTADLEALRLRFALKRVVSASSKNVIGEQPTTFNSDAR